MLCINKSVCVYVNVERHGDGDWQWGSRQAGEWSEEKELNVRASESQVLRRHRRSVQGRVWNSVCNKLPHGCVCMEVCVHGSVPGALGVSFVSGGRESGQVSRRPVTPWLSWVWGQLFLVHGEQREEMLPVLESKKEILTSLWCFYFRITKGIYT